MQIEWSKSMHPNQKLFFSFNQYLQGVTNGEKNDTGSNY